MAPASPTIADAYRSGSNYNTAQATNDYAAGKITQTQLAQVQDAAANVGNAQATPPVTSASAQAAANAARARQMPGPNAATGSYGLIHEEAAPFDEQPASVRNPAGGSSASVPNGTANPGSVAVGAGASSAAPVGGSGIFVNGQSVTHDANGQLVSAAPTPAYNFSKDFSIPIGVQKNLMQKYPDLATAGSNQHKAFLSTLAASGSNGSDASDIADRLFGGKNDAALRPSIVPAPTTANGGAATTFQPVSTAYTPGDPSFSTSPTVAQGTGVSLATGAPTPVASSAPSLVPKGLPQDTSSMLSVDDLKTPSSISRDGSFQSPGTQAANAVKTAFGNATDAASNGAGLATNALQGAAGNASDFVSAFVPSPVKSAMNGVSSLAAAPLAVATPGAGSGASGSSWKPPAPKPPPDQNSQTWKNQMAGLSSFNAAPGAPSFPASPPPPTPSPDDPKLRLAAGGT